MGYWDWLRAQQADKANKLAKKQLKELQAIRTSVAAAASPEPSAPHPRATSRCRHKQTEVQHDFTHKIVTRCLGCHDVVGVGVELPPTEVDPEALRTLQEWLESRPSTDKLAEYVRRATARWA